METISNAANAATTAASNLIWGDKTAQQAGAEPVAGETGRGTATEPFDGGNKDANTANTTTGTHSTTGTTGAHSSTGTSDLTSSTGTSGAHSSTGSSGLPSHAGTSGAHSSTHDSGLPSHTGTSGAHSSTHDSGLPSSTGTSGAHSSSGSSGLPPTGSSGGAQAVNAGGVPRPEHTTDKTGVTSIHSNDPHGSDIRPSEANENKPNVNAGGFGTAEPSVGADPSSAAQPTQKQQGGDRPNDAPSSGAETGAIKDSKDSAEHTQKKKDPNDHSGEPMRVHDGRDKEGEHPGQEGGDKHGEKGTGEQWVKTSGLAADGGDFDAAKPGAGKEADRLLETKGVHRSTDDVSHKSGPSHSPAGDDSAKDKDKPSIKDKIKDKLHIGKH